MFRAEHGERVSNVFFFFVEWNKVEEFHYFLGDNLNIDINI